MNHVCIYESPNSKDNLNLSRKQRPRDKSYWSGMLGGNNALECMKKESDGNIFTRVARAGYEQ